MTAVWILVAVLTSGALSTSDNLKAFRTPEACNIAMRAKKEAPIPAGITYNCEAVPIDR